MFSHPQPQMVLTLVRTASGKLLLNVVISDFYVQPSATADGSDFWLLFICAPWIAEFGIRYKFRVRKTLQKRDQVLFF
jgi:hypothetical protein